LHQGGLSYRVASNEPLEGLHYEEENAVSLKSVNIPTIRKMSVYAIHGRVHERTAVKYFADILSALSLRQGEGSSLNF